MESDELKQFRDLIEKRISELADELAAGHAATATVKLDQQMVGRLSRMDAIQQQAMAVAIEQRRKSEIQGLNAALVRVDEEEFGYCEDCGDDIPSDRLRINPTTPRCVSCAQG